MMADRRNREFGGVFIELGMMVPVLILVMAGLSNFGAYMSTLLWVEHTSYHISNVGANALPNERSLRMQDFGDRLRGYHKSSLHIFDSYSLAFTPKETDIHEPLETEVDMSGLSLFSGKVIPVDVETAAIPLIPTLIEDNELAKFQNPYVLQGCCGEAFGGSEDCVLVAPERKFKDCPTEEDVDHA